MGGHQQMLNIDYIKDLNMETVYSQSCQAKSAKSNTGGKLSLVLLL